MAEETDVDETEQAEDTHAERVEKAASFKELSATERNHKIRYSVFRWYDPTTSALRDKELEDTYENYALFCEFKGPAEAEYWKAQKEHALAPKTARTPQAKIDRSLSQVGLLMKEAKARGENTDGIEAMLANLLAEFKK
jgi:hypothetical protein